MKFMYHRTQCGVNYDGRVALVPSNINSHGRMVADTQDYISCIIDEHLGIFRIGTISGVCKAKILPDHNSMTVTSFKKLIISSLSDPVSDHIEVHIGMISDSNIIFTSAVLKIRFRKTPVSTTCYKTSPVDINIEYLIGVIENHFANSRFKLFFI